MNEETEETMRYVKAKAKPGRFYTPRETDEPGKPIFYADHDGEVRRVGQGLRILDDDGDRITVTDVDEVRGKLRGWVERGGGDIFNSGLKVRPVESISEKSACCGGLLEIAGEGSTHWYVCAVCEEATNV